MAWTTPRTWVATEVVTAAIMNTHVRDNLDYLKASPALTSPTFAGDIGLAATKKLYLDGVAMTGDTYISESSANTLSLFSGNVEAKLTSGVLTVSGFGTHAFSAGGTGDNILAVRQTTAGTANAARIYIGQDESASKYELLGTTSTWNTIAATYPANSLSIRSQGAGGIGILAEHASGAIRFYSGGTALRGTWNTSGELEIGTGGSHGKILNSSARILQIKGVQNGNIWNFNDTDGKGYQAGGGSWSDTSDARLKTNVETMADVDALRQLRPVWFDWRNPQEHHGEKRVGSFIAQDVQAIFPEWVSHIAATGADAALVPNGEALTLSLPNTFNALLVAGWQQHDAELAALRARVAELEAKIALLSHN